MIWINDRLVDARSARVSAFDHGFLYGDGVYETVHAYGYQIFHWPDHYRRFLNSASRIALRCPWAGRALERAVVKLLKANRQPNASVRITLARGPGPLGLDPSVCKTPTLVMMLHPHRDVERYQREGVSIGITQVRRNPPEALDPQIKSISSLNTIQAKMEANAMGVFEAILLNLKGELTEGTTSNIFFVKQGQLYTPSLACGLLPGITRGVVLKLAKLHEIPAHEGRYRPLDLLKAEEVFLTSTTLEVVPVVLLKSAGSSRAHPLGRGLSKPITRRLQQLFQDYVHHAYKASPWPSRRTLTLAKIASA